jgi:hypothetical protein
MAIFIWILKKLNRAWLPSLARAGGSFGDLSQPCPFYVFGGVIYETKMFLWMRTAWTSSIQKREVVMR